MVYDFDKILVINKSKITDDMVKQPEYFYYYSRMVDNLKIKLEIIDEKIEYTQAVISSQNRMRYSNNKDVKETKIRDLSKTNPELVKLKEERMVLYKKHKSFVTKVEALKVKSEMMINIANNLRAENRSLK